LIFIELLAWFFALLMLASLAFLEFFSASVLSDDDTQKPSFSEKSLIAISSGGNKGMEWRLFCYSIVY
jgi:hypothetical protein